MVQQMFHHVAYTDGSINAFARRNAAQFEECWHPEELVCRAMR